jgi:hypothetical protein
MQRQVPTVENDAIALYIRTYYSLLRSSGSVRVRSMEEAHASMGSSLHPEAASPEVDLGALVYAAVRLPSCMPGLRHLVLGQSQDQFARGGYADIGHWKRLRTPARRRRLQWNGSDTLAVYAVSASDIDDVIPTAVAYQIEWNKLHLRLAEHPDVVLELEGLGAAARLPPELARRVADAAGASPDALGRLEAAFAPAPARVLAQCAAHKLDLSITLLAGSFTSYQRAASRWWDVVDGSRTLPSRRVYFVSSNLHAMPNLLGGYARAQAEKLAAWVDAEDPEGLRQEHQRLLGAGDRAGLDNLYYYLMRLYGRDPERRRAMVAADGESGIRTIKAPDEIEVDAQLIELGRVRAANLDPRLRVDGIERLGASDALILNIDYPLGMAAYHVLARVLVELPELLGVFVMGKAASLNARVGDVVLSRVVHDEHSRNTFLFRNELAAPDFTPYLRYGSALDNQKALTVRSAFLQNRAFMDVFYTEGYTVMEMETGPYLSAVTEAQSPNRVPRDELVNLTEAPFPIGIVHYTSDTPYSRHKQLLSKSMSYFGVDATYACATAILRRIFQLEIARLGR